MLSNIFITLRKLMIWQILDLKIENLNSKFNDY